MKILLVLVTLSFSQLLFALSEIQIITHNTTDVIEHMTEESIGGEFYLTTEQADQIVELQELQVLEREAEEITFESIEPDCERDEELFSEEETGPEEEEDNFEIVLMIQSSTGSEIETNFAEEFSEYEISPRLQTIKEQLIATPENWESILESAANGEDALAVEEKFQLMASLGRDFLGDYNDQRGAETPDFSAVDFEALLTNLSDGTSRNGGVCRDISKAQLDMARALGVEDCYGVAYSTRTNHANVICKHPTNPGQFVRINYGFDNVTTGSGSEVLAATNGQPNQGLHTMIFNDRGESVKSVPLEMAEIFRSVTGESRDLMQGNQNYNYSIGKVHVRNNDNTFTAFAGQTSGGDKVTGLAYSRNLSENTFVSGAIANQEIATDKENYPDIRTSYFRFYSDNPIYRTNVGNTRVEAAIVTDVDVDYSSNGEDFALSTNYAPLSTHIRTQTDISEDTTINTDSSARFGLGTRDLATNRPDKVYVDEYKNQVSINSRFDAVDLYGAMEVIHSEISNTYVVEAGARRGNHSVMFRQQGALDDETPQFLPEAVDRQAVSYRYTRGNSNFFVEYAKQDDRDMIQARYQYMFRR